MNYALPLLRDTASRCACMRPAPRSPVRQAVCRKTSLIRSPKLRPVPNGHSLNPSSPLSAATDAHGGVPVPRHAPIESWIIPAMTRAMSTIENPTRALTIADLPRSIW